MIRKEKAERRSRNRKEASGEAAEKQMAFYLRRKFGEDPNVHVFNDLRFVRDDEVAQMDHLVLHRHGFFIVESKSVTGEIQVNDQLEFIRVHGRKRTGMASPIQQAKRQGALLRQLLIDRKSEVRRKQMFGLVQGGFKNCPIQPLVAISDQGIIKRPRRPVPELLKADQVADRIASDALRHRDASKLISNSDGGWGTYSFHAQEIEAVAALLLACHTDPSPLMPAGDAVGAAPRPVQTQPSSHAGTTPVYLCSKCHATNLQIRFGRSYYFRCLECDGNTPIKNRCRGCGSVAKTQKRKAEFRSVCGACGLEELFFRNPG